MRACLLLVIAFAPPETESGTVSIEGSEPAPSVPAPVELEPAPAPELPPETPPPPAEPPPEPDVDDEAADYDPRVDSPEARKAKGWIVSGSVALGVGVGLGIGAIVTGLSDPCAEKGGNNCFEDARDRAALTMGIPAAVLVASGVAMLTVGLVQRKKLRRELAVAPMFGPVQGLSFAARF